MSSWDVYEARAEVHGITQRETSLKREKRYLTTKLPKNLSYNIVTIDGIEQNVSILNTDNLNEKIITSMPGETIKHGGLVDWMDNYWLVDELDANNTLYAKGKLLQCNYLLKWVDDKNVIHEQWCAIEDGTKLSEIVSVQRNLYVKILTELLELPKAYNATA